MDIQTLDSSGFTMKTELNYATPWSRIGASLLDGLVVLPLTALTLYNTYSLGSIPVFLVASLLTILYKPVFEAAKGATPGKMMLKLKVVQQDGSPISTDQAVQRFIPWIILYLVSVLSTYLLMTSAQYERADGWMEIMTIQQSLPALTTLSYVNMLLSAGFIGLLISLAVDRRHQGWHDKLAKTYVISGKKKPGHATDGILDDGSGTPKSDVII